MAAESDGSPRRLEAGPLAYSIYAHVPIAPNCCANSHPPPKKAAGFYGRTRRLTEARGCYRGLEFGKFPPRFAHLFPSSLFPHRVSYFHLPPTQTSDVHGRQRILTERPSPPSPCRSGYFARFNSSVLTSIFLPRKPRDSLAINHGENGRS